MYGIHDAKGPQRGSFEHNFNQMFTRKLSTGRMLHAMFRPPETDVGEPGNLTC